MMNTTFSEGEDFNFPVVNLPSGVKSHESIVRYLVEELVRAGHIDAKHTESITLQVLKRESLGSTAIGRAFAVPHVKSSLIDAILGIVGKCAQPVAWPGAADNKPVHTICLLITPESNHGEGLKALRVMAQKFWQPPGKT
jgi:mannitol/fructose-specific phosphotransferase system IIA component (Ntr-type)